MTHFEEKNRTAQKLLDMSSELLCQSVKSIFRYDIHDKLYIVVKLVFTSTILKGFVEISYLNMLFTD
jgi:hypothetical protein